MLRQHPQSVQAANAAYQQDLCALLCVSAQPSAPAQGGDVPGIAVAELQLPGLQDITSAPTRLVAVTHHMLLSGSNSHCADKGQ